MCPNMFLLSCACALDQPTQTWLIFSNKLCAMCPSGNALVSFSLYACTSRYCADAVCPHVFLFVCARSLNTHASTRGALLGTSCMQWTCVTAFSSFSLCTRGVERRRADALRPRMFLFVCACSLCSLRHHLQTYTQRNPASISGGNFRCKFGEQVLNEAMPLTVAHACMYICVDKREHANNILAHDGHYKNEKVLF